MIHLGRILAFCALAAGTSLAPSQAHAQPRPVLQDTYIPRLGASVYASPGYPGAGGVVINYVDPRSPLRRMYSSYFGSFYAEPGDVILSANNVRIRDAEQLSWIVDNMNQRTMQITIYDSKTGRELSGSVQLY
ncbi:hypothetical protein ACMHYB_24250 [Sorangium sp. So ce1128]